MYSPPLAPNSLEPFALLMKTGEPPTARKARTGEFTPPGKRRSARSSRRAEISSLMQPLYLSAAWGRASEGTAPYIRRQQPTWNVKHFRVTLHVHEAPPVASMLA